MHLCLSNPVSRRRRLRNSSGLAAAKPSDESFCLFNFFFFSLSFYYEKPGNANVAASTLCIFTIMWHFWKDSNVPCAPPPPFFFCSRWCRRTRPSRCVNQLNRTAQWSVFRGNVRSAARPSPLPGPKLWKDSDEENSNKLSYSAFSSLVWRQSRPVSQRPWFWTDLNSLYSNTGPLQRVGAETLNKCSCSVLICAGCLIVLPQEAARTALSVKSNWMAHLYPPNWFGGSFFPFIWWVFKCGVCVCEWRGEGVRLCKTTNQRVCQTKRH